ncbi:MAG TPA: hypothetical protein VF739_01100 [Ktedonobacterales bacterium]
MRRTLANRLERNPEFGNVRETLSEERADEHSFFIKNLESVQGDERDVMVLSIGYGRDRHGVFHSNFGPLNKKGGARRLGMAIRERAGGAASLVEAGRRVALVAGGSRGISLRGHSPHVPDGDCARTIVHQRELLTRWRPTHRSEA